MIAITGASGYLGRLVIAELLGKVPPAKICAIVRDTDKVRDLAALGVQVRLGDYNKPSTLGPAFAGVDKLLMISGNDVGHRVPQHRAVIEAAKSAGVELIAYTSVLRAHSSQLALAAEHKATEDLLLLSGVPYVLLRNGWYTENYLASVPASLQHGVFIGSAGEGRIASAARADYAAAAVVILTSADQAGLVYELAGDDAYTLNELAAEISHQSDKPVKYQNLPETAFKSALVAAGVPEPFATLLADSDAAAARGALFDDGRQLSKLIGRATTALSQMVKAAVVHQN